jgi:putative ABC transport system ATP-binding protein
VEPAIKAVGVKKTFFLGKQNVQVLKGIDLEIQPSEFVALVGPSGSGKSTLLGIIGGLDFPDEGQVIVNGIEITRMRESALAQVRSQQFGMIFQLFNLIPTLTAQENVELPLHLRNRGKDSPVRRARELLEMVDLGHRLKHKPSELSGGEQQRVSIARALACRPAIILADEPTGNLDSVTGEGILDLLQDLREQNGITLFLVTHDRTVAERSDRQLRLIDGRLES